VIPSLKTIGQAFGVEKARAIRSIMEQFVDRHPPSEYPASPDPGKDFQHYRWLRGGIHLQGEGGEISSYHLC